MSTNPKISREAIPWSPALWGRLKPAWSELRGTSSVVSGFLSCEWVETWLEVFGQAHSATGVIWRSDGKCVGCAVLAQAPVNLGPFRLSRIGINTVPAAGLGTEHSEVLALAPFRDAVLQDLISLVADTGAQEMAVDGAQVGLWKDLVRLSGARRYEVRRSRAPYVSLSTLRSSGKTFLESVSANTRSQIRRSVKLYTKRHGEPQLLVASSGREAADWLELLVELHNRKWNALGKTGAFSEPRRRFHDLLVSRCQTEKESDLSVHVVRVSFGDHVVGYLYNLIDGDVVQFYQSGFEYSDDNKLKPGLTTHTLAVQHYMREGFSEYDFLGGEAAAVQYKESLATDSRTLFWGQLPGASLTTRVAWALRKIRRAIPAGEVRRRP